MSAPGALGESEVEPTRPFGVATVPSPSEPVIDKSNDSPLTRMLREDLVRILAERDLFRRQLDERPTREEYIALAEACESWSARAKKAEAMLEAVRAAVR